MYLIDCNSTPSVHPEPVEGLNGQAYLKLNPFMVRQAHHERKSRLTTNGVTIFPKKNSEKVKRSRAYKIDSAGRTPLLFCECLQSFRCHTAPVCFSHHGSDCIRRIIPTPLCLPASLLANRCPVSPHDPFVIDACRRRIIPRSQAHH